MNRISKKNFSQKIAPFQKMLERKSLQMTRDKYLADDLYQETLFRAFKALHTYKQDTNLKAWLFRILINTYIGDYRKKTNEAKNISFQDIECSQIQDRNKSIEASSDLGFSDDTHNAIFALRPNYRTVVIYSDIYGFSYEEISKKLAIPMGTVMSRIFRARKELKSTLINVAYEYGYNKVAS